MLDEADRDASALFTELLGALFDLICLNISKDVPKSAKLTISPSSFFGDSRWTRSRNSERSFLDKLILLSKKNNNLKLYQMVF